MTDLPNKTSDGTNDLSQATPTPVTPDPKELEAQLTLLFYGEDALQDYRQNGDLTVTVYQAVKLFTQAQQKLLSELVEQAETYNEYNPESLTDDSVEAVPVSVINRFREGMK